MSTADSDEGAVVLAFPGPVQGDDERVAAPRRLAGLVLGGLESLGRTMSAAPWPTGSRGQAACCTACGAPLPGPRRVRPGPDEPPPAS